MAVRVDDNPSVPGQEGEVSHCVSSLIQAFSNGINIFKRLRERRQKHKARKQNQALESANSAELQLSNSLRRGPMELAEKYEECYMQRNMGRRFAKGDRESILAAVVPQNPDSDTAIAHSSLAETLIKLNTGLVGIIAAFLNHDSCDGKGGDNNLNLDYKSLIDLSDASRRQALQSMTSLYQRLSQSQLQLQLQLNSCIRCGSTSHIDCSDRGTNAGKEKRKRTHPRQRSNGRTVTRMPIKSSSEPQLVFVRSRHTKKGSSDSSSNSSKSALSLEYTSPLASPAPEYALLDPFMNVTPDVSRATIGGSAIQSVVRKRIDSLDATIPANWQPKPPKPAYAVAPPANIELPAPKLPDYTTMQKRNSTASTLRKPVPQRITTPLKPLPPTPLSPPVRRRLDKATPSTYTFASDSTKLGEIPQRNWMTPWDYEEAERLNAEATVAPAPTPVLEEKIKTKKGLFKFLR
jgi:hypothetical protein